jgi:predicted GIY-YIG superfamily endonuclease
MNPSRYYVGLTRDLERRLKEHNAEKSGYSSRYSPWEIETYITFKNSLLAEKFERYLKIGSGQSFLIKHLF